MPGMRRVVLAHFAHLRHLIFSEIGLRHGPEGVEVHKARSQRRWPRQRASTSLHFPRFVKT